MSPGKRTLTEEELREVHRAAADGAGKIVQGEYADPPVSDGFRDGVVGRRRLDGLLREEDIGRPLHGPDEVIRFPAYFHDAFAEMGKPEVRNLVTLVTMKPELLAALIRVAQREADRTVLHRIWGVAWKASAAIAVPVYSFMRWGADTIPVLRDLIHSIRGHGP